MSKGGTDSGPQSSARFVARHQSLLIFDQFHFAMEAHDHGDERRRVRFSDFNDRHLGCNAQAMPVQRGNARADDSVECRLNLPIVDIEGLQYAPYRKQPLEARRR